MSNGKYKDLLEQMLECINKMFKDKGLEHQNELCLASSKYGNICAITTQENYENACKAFDAVEDKIGNDIELQYLSPKKTFEDIVENKNMSLMISLKDDNGNKHVQLIQPRLMFGKTFEEMSIKIDLMLRGIQ